MKKNLKNKKIIIYAIIVVFLILVLSILNNNFKIIEKITNGKLKNADEETTELPLISYQVYDNSDESKIKILVTVNDNSGIEYVEYPDGTKIEANNKQQVSLDYNMAKDKNYTFKIKTADNENIQESTICANDEFINDKGVSISKINNENGYKVIDIENQINLDGFKTYYQIGKNGNWIEGTGKIGLTDYDLATNNLLNEDNTITINAKIENATTKNTVNITKKYEVETNVQNNTYSAESLLKALENDEISTGVYQVTVEDELYNLKVYSFNENLNIKANTTLGTEEDVATASEYAKNMIVLKVNGDLTIDEGATLTAYASKDGYGGPKGMTIYCTGTITNNGTISMTARGAKAEGQNVYLFKNIDNTYEYVPAVGADGGDKVKNNKNGKSGMNGTDRQTGGGGSGAASDYELSISGHGGIGTSYSGGTGGGGSHGQVYGQNGLENGATGGYGFVEGGRGTAYDTGSGAGNPAGTSKDEFDRYCNFPESNGTGGLLIIYGNEIKNNQNILSKGIVGGYASWVGGGSSGGGSINLFYKNKYESLGILNANGGIPNGGKWKGGAGGTGSISIGQIIDGTYTSTYTNY
ncbi:hypothetical protein EGR52_05840 [bacterium]|nr:hypothetical protein [bacterium]